MLTELHIREYALVEELRVEFGPGLTVLSGETGAGKSILLGALSFILGERVDSDVIRAGSDTAIVEAVFDLSRAEEVVQVLDTQGVEVEAGVLILKRELSRNSRGRCHANNSPMALGVLKRIGDELVDFHGQHAHQLLLDPDRHLDFLDGFGHLTDLGLRAREAFQQCEKLKGHARALAEREAILRERRDLYEFQEREIRLARIVPGEEEVLKEKKNLWENAEKLSILVAGILRRLEEGEGAVLGSLGRSERDLDEISRLDPQATREKEPLGMALIHLEELRRSLEAYGQRLQFEPARLEEVRDRLDLLRRLKQKYGGTLETVLQHGEEAGKALRSLESGEEERKTLSGRLRTAESTLAETSGELRGSAQRLRANSRNESGTSLPIWGWRRRYSGLRSEPTWNLDYGEGRRSSSFSRPTRASHPGLWPTLPREENSPESCLRSRRFSRTWTGWEPWCLMRSTRVLGGGPPRRWVRSWPQSPREGRFSASPTCRK